MKICNCEYCNGREKPLTEFYTRTLKNGGIGYLSKCKEFYQNKQKEKYAANPEYQKEWAKNNYQYNIERNKKWRDNNKEKTKAYYENNKEKIKKRTGERSKIPEVKERQWSLYINRKYNITSEKYYEMEKQQNYQCAICKTDDKGTTGKWHIDHCHDTKDVRGLLCQSCNTGIGKLKHDKQLLQEAIKYLDT